jgi:signal transduction histidine kinase
VAVVQDTGPGIPREKQQQIFEPLVSSRAKGMGLGLTLGRRIVEAHGGEIRLDSEPGNGATFTVELPLTERLMTTVYEESSSH